MDGPQPPGIRLTRPSGVTDAAQTLLGGWFLPVAKIAGAATPFGAAVEGVAEIVRCFRPEDTAAEAGWRLVYAGLERAIVDIVQPFRHRATSGKSLPIDHLMQQGGRRIDFNSIEAPADFLDQPKSLPILAEIRPLLQAALVYLDVDEAAARSAADRLPGYFVLALEATWRDHKAGLAAIEDLTKSPIALAARQERHWHYYRAVLEHELEQPLFAGDFSLRQLYQPLRGYWAERSHEGRVPGREVRHVVDLATTFDGWLDRFDANDALRVVTGGPGSGKSSFVKWWAAHVLWRDPLLPTLVVPLHRLDSFDLEQEVWKHAQLHNFAKNPLALDGGERRLLLILDGLDELDADHKTGREAASVLVTRLDRLLERNRHGHELRVVIAGRELIINALRGELDRERQVFHVLGYLPLARNNDWKDPGGLLGGDQRRAWWQAWGRLTGEALDEVPTSIAENEQLAELTDQPLLNHLLAVTRAAAPEALGEQSSINTVYATMLDHVWQRSWGDERQLPTLKRVAKDDFRRLFESIGLAVWQYGGGRTTTLDVVAEIARREKLGAQLDVLADGAKNQALDLLTAFYFRRDATAETFELTHKSFGEYFAAMRLLRLIESLHHLGEDPEFNPEDGLRRWYRWTYSARITIEILGFLERALANLTLEEVRARRATLIRLFDLNLRIGMAHMGSDSVKPANDFREAQLFDAAAELALLAAIGACSAVLLDRCEERPIKEQQNIVQWQPAWPNSNNSTGKTEFQDLLHRLSIGQSLNCLAKRFLIGINIDNQYSIIVDLSGGKMNFTSAKNSTFFYSCLVSADLSNANLDGAFFGGADLSRVDLRNARGLTRKQLKAALNVNWKRVPADLPDE